MGNLSTHFSVEEFVPEVIFKAYGLNSKWFIDQRLVILAEYIRGYFDEAVTINNWNTGGDFQNRGYRTPGSPVGAKLSQHRYGRAMDINVHGYSSDEVNKAIIDNFEKFKANGLTTIENVTATPTWTHVDIRWTGLETLLIVNP